MPTPARIGCLFASVRGFHRKGMRKQEGPMTKNLSGEGVVVCFKRK